MYSFIHTLIHTYFISAFRSQLEKLSIEQLALITYTITSMPPPVEMLKPGSFQSSFVQLKLKQELYFNDIKFVVEAFGDTSSSKYENCYNVQDRAQHMQAFE